MARIYLPDEIDNSQCVVFQSDNVLRVYDSVPRGTIENGVTYIDYYLDYNYLKTNGTVNFDLNTSFDCMDINQFTTDKWDRPDIWQSLICFIIIAIICLWIPFKLISRLFGRWLKL